MKSKYASEFYTWDEIVEKFGSTDDKLIISKYDLIKHGIYLKINLKKYAKNFDLNCLLHSACFIRYYFENPEYAEYDANDPGFSREWPKKTDYFFENFTVEEFENYISKLITAKDWLVFPFNKNKNGQYVNSLDLTLWHNIYNEIKENEEKRKIAKRRLKRIKIKQYFKTVIKKYLIFVLYFILFLLSVKLLFNLLIDLHVII